MEPLDLASSFDGRVAGRTFGVELSIPFDVLTDCSMPALMIQGVMRQMHTLLACPHRFMDVAVYTQIRLKPLYPGQLFIKMFYHTDEQGRPL